MTSKFLTFSFLLFTSSLLLAAPKKDAYDIRPSDRDLPYPTAVVWQSTNDVALAAATTEDAIAACVADEESACTLLGRVKGAYASDPTALTQIGAVSQWVMTPDPCFLLFWKPMPSEGRRIWIEALLERARTAKDDYVKTVCLDQLRWCGTACRCVIDGITEIGNASGSKAVKDLSDLVVRELEFSREGGFVSLFNGRDLAGWESNADVYGVDPKEPGVLQCFAKRGQPEGTRADLFTAREYGDFILRFEFVLSDNANNGVGIRVTDKAKSPAFHATCEVQLLDDGGDAYFDRTAKKDRLKQPNQYNGSLYGMVAARRDNPATPERGGTYLKPTGEWNFMEIKVVGSTVEVWQNGVLVTQADTADIPADGTTPDGYKHPGLRNRRGRISFIGHGWDVKWRNIRIKELD